MRKFLAGFVVAALGCLSAFIAFAGVREDMAGTWKIDVELSLAEARAVAEASGKPFSDAKQQKLTRELEENQARLFMPRFQGNTITVPGWNIDAEPLVADEK